MRRHLIILLVLTVLTRGTLMISYPLSVTDDNQAAQTHLIDQLLQGNFRVGNLRYQPGYALVMAPFAALAQPFGRFSDRLILLLQVAVSATIPFMVYDILRRRSPRQALIVALFVLLDPFGWQWAHFYLPEWLVATCLVAALWLLVRGSGSLLSAIAAGLVLGLAALLRLNVIPAVALLCLLVFALRQYSLRRRAELFFTLALTSGALVLLYLVGIHYPSTGTLRPNCISGVSLIESLNVKSLPIEASNGTESARYLELSSRTLPREILFLGDTFDHWQQPDAWATPAEQQAFLAGTLSGSYPMNDYALAYYLGPCAADDLERGAFLETVAAHPLQWVERTVRLALVMLAQSSGYADPVAGTLLLPRYESLTFEPGGVLGFQHAVDGYYTGQWVWTPGIRLYPALFPLMLVVSWLIIPALIWALWTWSGNWFYAAAALLLLATALSLTAVDNPESRIYAAAYPLTPILIGGMSAALVRRLERH